MKEPRYQHDMMHCSQERCEKKDRCYRFWLGQNFRRFGYEYISVYWPDPNEDLGNCEYFIDIQRYKD